jgi:hypothetical protein
LLEVLDSVNDPRHRRGVRHRLTSVLGIALSATLAGARSFATIADWAADAPAGVLALLEVVGAVRSESMIRRVLQRLSGDG